jgi:hypothetical protein
MLPTAPRVRADGSIRATGQENQGHRLGRRPSSGPHLRAACLRRGVHGQVVRPPPLLPGGPDMRALSLCRHGAG